ncbi:MAG: glycosyltransferase family 2 protein [Melioribacteraceae bacterium]
MNQSPLISIITVVLNGAKYLENAIKSVLSQSYSKVEYIIIDGGSTNGTLDIIKKYESRISKLISEPDNGISDAFNKGIKLASGEIIGLLNSDDWLEPDAIKKIVKIFSSDKPDIICGAVRFWEKEKEVIVSYPDLQNLDRETSIHHSGVFIKKSIYEKFGLFDTHLKYAMDYELLLRMKMNNVKFYLLNDVVSNRRLEGISYKNKRLALRETMSARKNYFNIWNVWIIYLYASIKDCGGRLLKSSILKPLYITYWKLKNRKLARDPKE